MDIYITDGTFNTLKVDILNVKQLNCINDNNIIYHNNNYNDKNNKNKDDRYRYYNINNLVDKYNGFDIKYTYDNDNYQVDIKIKLLNIGTIILDLSNVNFDFVNIKSSDMSLDSILCINDSKIYIDIELPELSLCNLNNNKIKIMIRNPNNYNIRFIKHNINNNLLEQSYKFIYIDEIKKWLLNYKL
jgi:hypothetical protein